MSIRKAVAVAGALLALTAGVSSVSAQGLYVDGGFGVGAGWTSVDGRDVGKLLGSDVGQIAVDVGIRVGFGPVGGMPLYLVGDLSGMGHRFYDDYYIQYNTYLIGPGVIFYPVPIVQVGASMGYSYTANTTDIPRARMADGEGGFAWNMSAAIDISGERRRGWLFGVKYFGAYNSLESNAGDLNQGMIAAFFRYVIKD